MRSSIGSPVLATLALGIGASLASAASVTYTDTIDLAQTPWNLNLDLPKFDSSLGTLTSVTLSVQTGVSSSITVTNNHATQDSTGISINTQTEVLTTLPQSLGSFTFAVNSSSGTVSLLGPGQSTSFTALSGTGNSGAKQYTSQSVLDAFTGGGTISIPVGTTVTTYTAATGGNIGYSQITSADAVGSVTYEYVPEPVMLGGAGLVVAGLMRRRRLA